MSEQELFLITIEKAVELIELAMSQPNPKKHQAFIQFQLDQINKQVNNIRNLG